MTVIIHPVNNAEITYEQETHYLQSSHRNEIIKKQFNAKITQFLISKSNCKPTLLSIQHFPWYFLYSSKALNTHLPNDLDTTETKIVLNYLKNIKWKNMSLKICLTPDPVYNDCKKLLHTQLHTKVWSTYILTLENMSEQDLLMNYNKSTRKNIKKFRSKINIVQIKTECEFKDIFWKGYCESENSHQRKVGKFNPYIWDDNKIYSFYVAFDNDKNPLAYLGVITYNNMCFEVMSSLTQISKLNGYPAQDLIHHHIFIEAMQNNISYFDFAGANPSPNNPSEIGIKKFKEKFGGRQILYPIYEI